MFEESDQKSSPWWSSQKSEDSLAVPKLPRAVAYYRHSAQDRQENSVAIQQEQVQQWARENGVEIIHEFMDRGKSGLTAEGRDAFNDMMENWIKRRTDFELVLCLDVSRWGRFQDFDLSATYSAECKHNGKEVVYTSLGKPKKNDPLFQVYVQFERFRAAQYSKELSEKVLRGCIKIAQQGYWAGGKPPYGFQRLLLNESRMPVQVLDAGQRKSIQNQRVTLAPGDESRVNTIKRIFREFAEVGLSMAQVAAGLNGDGIASPGGGNWSGSKVRAILTNELYIGTMVYNKTTQKLKTRSRQNPSDEWVKTANAFDAIVARAMFDKAKDTLAKAANRFTPGSMLEQLTKLFQEHGFLRPSLLQTDAATPSASTFCKRFGSLDAAYQQVFSVAVKQVKVEVESLVRGLVGESGVESYDDFLVVNRKFTLLIQPSVPIAHGYSQYWYFRPDVRRMVDITLGVPVSGTPSAQILGYLALPRLLAPGKGIRLFGSSESRLDMYGHTGLETIFQLARF